MKFIIASDIHGSAHWCEKLVKVFNDEKADRLILLGDILYHGPRNPLPDGYNPAEVAKMLSPVADKIICVRGNCDSEVDQMVLPFNVSSDYGTVFADGLNIHLSHGHRAVPPLKKGEIYITGHTHVPMNAVEGEGYFHLNPGSVSLPKEDSRHGYILFENGVFTFKDFSGEKIDVCSPLS